MKYLILVGLVGLAGCAQLEQVRDELASPQTTAAVGNLRAGAQALVCAIANVAAVTSQIEQAVSAGDAIVGTTGKVYTVSTIVCASLGGKVTGISTVK